MGNAAAGARPAHLLLRGGGLGSRQAPLPRPRIVTQRLCICWRESVPALECAQAAACVLKDRHGESLGHG